MLRICLTLGVVYFLFALTVTLLQRRMIYYPTTMDPRVAGQIAAREGFEPWRNSANEIIGWRWPAGVASNGVVLIVHGNAGCAIDRSYLAVPIRAGGSVDVFALEYPGYGVRGGSPTEQSLLAAAEEAFDQLPKNVPVYIVGESLGTGVAAHLAKRYSTRIAGVAVFGAYDDFVSVAQDKMPILPVRLLLRDRFNPAKWLRDYHGPVAIVLAEADEVVPAKFGRRLHDGYEGPKKLDIIPAGHHNDIGQQSPDWWKGVFTFWEQNGKSRAGQ